MATEFYLSGLKPISGGVTTPASTATAQSFSLTGITQTGRRGTLEVIASIRGAAPVWVSYDPNFTPTVGTGIELGTPSAAAPIIIRIRGQQAIQAFKVIGTATWTYQFFTDDLG
jgi:hypothetical protein